MVFFSSMVRSFFVHLLLDTGHGKFRLSIIIYYILLLYFKGDKISTPIHQHERLRLNLSVEIPQRRSTVDIPIK